MALTSFPFSSSFNTPQFVYEVFISFRGEDTRYNFTSHLYKALDDKGIQTFIDYELKRGDEISPALLKAIEESQISVIIFSKDYASSRWCLEELVKILECKNRESNKQIVIPVFYGVTPSDVRNQTGNFADAFAKHEEDFRDNLDKVQRWKDALNEAANLSGWHFDANDKKPESVLIEAIVEDVLTRLSDLSSSDISHLVGIDSKIKEIKSWLFMGTNDVRSVGIWGIGGIGKTTLAEAVFNNISRRFEGSCFIHNVREQCEQSGALNRLQQEFLSRILGDKNVNKGAYVVGRTFVKNRLGRKKLLIVLDDVSDFRQLECLIGDFDCLSQESRIIVTTRDKQVLRSCGVDQIYEVQELIHQEALQLFCKYAFKGNHATVDFMKLSYRVTRRAGGVPLALKILGSHLLDKGKEVWKSAMNKLKRIPHTDIHKVLRISYDGLDDEVQKIFLDIACFFKGSDIKLVKSFLDACGFDTEIGISVLIDKSLVFMSYNNQITMHDLIRVMAWEIVRKESIEDPGKCSRLWNHKDIFRVLTKNTGTETIEGISLDMSKVRDMFLNPYAFANMHKLRFLEFSISCYKENRNKVHVFQGLESNFSELRYLKWYACPLESLPSSYHLDNLVTLHMRNSKIKQLWNGVQHLVKLKEIDLASSSLTNCLDLSGFPNLERLILRDCIYLSEISSSLQYLTKLDLLDLGSCISLKCVPDCSGLTSLRKLDLSNCSNLEIFPEMPYNIKELYLRFTAIEELPLSIMYLSRLVVLNLTHCQRLKSLPSSISKWKSLKTLIVSVCSKLDQLPNDIGTLDSLEVLEVERTAIKELPSSIADLKNLKQLTFNRCTQTTVCWSLPRILGWLNLTVLNLSYGGIIELPDNLGCLSSLEALYLAGNGIESITASFTNLKLRFLDIGNCSRLKCLPELQLREIRAPGCTSLEVLPRLSFQESTGPPYHIQVDFGCCFKIDRSVYEDAVKDALLKQCQKEHCGKGDEDTIKDVQFWYPGNEIPKWFEFQRAGSSITVELPPDWFNHNFVGFALCVVLAPHLNYGTCLNTSISVRWNCTFKSKDGNHHVKDGSSSIFAVGERCIGSHVLVKSHMPISPYELLCYDNEISLNFNTIH